MVSGAHGACRAIRRGRHGARVRGRRAALLRWRARARPRASAGLAARHEVRLHQTRPDADADSYLASALILCWTKLRARMLPSCPY